MGLKKTFLENLIELIHENVLSAIGSTPHVRLNKLVGENDAQVIAKLEYFNPGFSIKDRTAFYMIEEAQKKGLLKPDSIIVEPTSGNTGIGLAIVCAVKGYKLKLTMPDNMSVERRKILAALGAEIVLTQAEKGMAGAIEKAKELAKADNKIFIPMQFENEANVLAHKETTAKEIEGEVGEFDAFVAGVGTGGTLTGVAQALKDKMPKAKFIAVEPIDSAVLSGEKSGVHKIQGIGAGFVPKILRTDLIDEVIKVSAEDSFETARRLAKEEGIFCGISSGANVWAAVQVAKKLGKGKRVVVIIPDSGERYLSSGLFG